MSLGMALMCHLAEQAAAQKECDIAKNDRKKYLNQYLNKKPEPIKNLRWAFTKPTERKS